MCVMDIGMEKPYFPPKVSILSINNNSNNYS